jgi:formate dehydrogenase subunit gamma
MLGAPAKRGNDVKESDLERQAVDAAIAQFSQVPGGLLPLFHDVQDRIGYVPEAALERIAAATALSAAEVFGTLRFYHHFRTLPPGKHVLQVCLGEACLAQGSHALMQRAKQCLGVDSGETTRDGNTSLETVYCLGNCGCGPSITVDGDLRGRVQSAEFEQALQECQQS